MRKTILLADDSPTIQRLVTQTFADGNFDIVSVSNGDAAIKKFEELHPSLVIADIYMPGKNGYEVCAYVKHHASRSKTPVVLLVGAFEAYEEETGKQAGASASITKPFEPHALVELVTSLMTAPEEEAAPDESADLMGLESLFHEEEPAESAAPANPSPAMSEEDIERIADRVIQKLSTQVIEKIAWDVVPDISEKIIREELKKAR